MPPSAGGRASCPALMPSVWLTSSHSSRASNIVLPSQGNLLAAASEGLVLTCLCMQRCLGKAQGLLSLELWLTRGEGLALLLACPQDQLSGPTAGARRRWEGIAPHPLTHTRAVGSALQCSLLSPSGHLICTPSARASSTVLPKQGVGPALPSAAAGGGQGLE